jgi:DNA polymerase sigma
VLVVKSLLKEAGLNDVSTGGLGSFALANMALSHLLEEAKVCNDVEPLLSTLRTSSFVPLTIMTA